MKLKIEGKKRTPISNKHLYVRFARFNGKSLP